MALTNDLMNCISASRALGMLVLAVSVYACIIAIYNMFFHPLARFPGPPLWRLTRLAYLRSMLSGNLHKKVRSFHEKYGDVVRIAPDEVSIARSDAYIDIYTNRGDSMAFPKTKVFHGPPKGRAITLVSAIDPKEHSRHRRLLNPGFMERALLSQECILQQYVSSLISGLRRETSANEDGVAVVDIVRWINFTTFDIMGDLAFGEHFDCLKETRFHRWITLIDAVAKAAALFAAVRLYPVLSKPMSMVFSMKAMKEMTEHRQLTEKIVSKRLNTDVERPDIISLMGKGDTSDRKEGFSNKEIQATASMLIIAGSETTASTASGTLNHLVRNPGKLVTLTKEVRSKFADQKDVTLAALKELPYLNAVINEGLRMCNPVLNGLIRQVPEGNATVAGIVLPANVYVNVPPYTLCSSSQRWHEAESFRPERWLVEATTDTSSPYFTDDRDALRTFGLGPRGCLGKSLAMAELRLIIARLVWAFDFEKAETMPGSMRWEDLKVFALVERRPFEVRLRPRSGT